MNHASLSAARKPCSGSIWSMQAGRGVGGKPAGISLPCPATRPKSPAPDCCAQRDPGAMAQACVANGTAGVTAHAEVCSDTFGIFSKTWQRLTGSALAVLEVQDRFFQDSGVVQDAQLADRLECKYRQTRWQGEAMPGVGSLSRSHTGRLLFRCPMLLRTARLFFLAGIKTQQGIRVGHEVVEVIRCDIPH